MKNIRNSYQFSRFAPAIGITLLTAAMLSATGLAQAADEAPATPAPGATTDGAKTSPPKATKSMKDNTAPEKMTTENSERVMSDSWITTKVKSEILANSVSKAFKVSVTTKSGAVKLGGKLPSQDSIDLVKMIAEKVDGVKSVDTSGLSTTM
jgi:hyperosmotically inducible protein